MPLSGGPVCTPPRAGGVPRQHQGFSHLELAPPSCDAPPTPPHHTVGVLALCYRAASHLLPCPGTACPVPSSPLSPPTHTRLPRPPLGTSTKNSPNWETLGGQSWPPCPGHCPKCTWILPAAAFPFTDGTHRASALWTLHPSTSYPTDPPPWSLCAEMKTFSVAGRVHSHICPRRGAHPGKRRSRGPGVISFPLGSLGRPSLVGAALALGEPGGHRQPSGHGKGCP